MPSCEFPARRITASWIFSGLKSARSDGGLPIDAGVAVEEGGLPVACEAAGALEGCKAAVVVRAAPADDGRVASEEETPFATPVGAPSELPLSVVSLMRIIRSQS